MSKEPNHHQIKSILDQEDDSNSSQFVGVEACASSPGHDPIVVRSVTKD